MLLLTIPRKVGIISWLATCFYFVIEPFFMMTSTAPYSLMQHAMSDLGVTSCGHFTYAIAPHEICSPYHLWMNVLFIINGITMTVGVLYLAQYLEKKVRTKLATIFMIILALGNIVSGFIPADVDFFWHSIAAQIGMITVLPGLWIYAKMLNNGKRWTYICLFALIVIFVLIILLFFVPLPAGLLQRLFYGIVFVWGTVLTFILTDSSFESS
ncbi:DUF998 domain-containing protein [Oceanobacillus profundus]|uniref:DUF998 domain-containing protein n=1 Tax=Oceanobacillus profundus TaxID=372463 RepID=UPI0026E1BB32|nr:DUF998 domain-containing protein [Oceanobacillus profundus]MDO6449402.1 DUF998 domain-containing protein [Oceanobacillus profundus]